MRLRQLVWLVVLFESAVGILIVNCRPLFTVDFADSPWREVRFMVLLLGFLVSHNRSVAQIHWRTDLDVQIARHHAQQRFKRADFLVYSLLILSTDDALTV